MYKFIFLLIFLLCFTDIFSQNHQVYLRNQNSIPLYYQETDYWCGAASAQMSLMGYPNGVNHSFNQTNVWNTIQRHKVEKMWATDPAGLRGALNELGRTPDGEWEIFYWRKGYNPGPNLMYHVALWMTRLRHPVVATVYGHGHALVITGVTTNTNPVNSNSVNVISVEIHDPWPPFKGAYSQISAATWYSRYYYPPQKDMGSAWDGCMLATILHQPQTTSKADVIGLNLTEQNASMEIPLLALDGAILSPEKIIEIAKEIKKNKDLFEATYQKALAKSKLHEPILVNKTGGAYYLVPFSQDNSSLENGALMLNAYDGSFEAITVFAEPFNMVTESDIRKSLQVDERANVEAIFEPSQQCRSPFVPVWKYSDSRNIMYVDYEGKVHSQLTNLLE